MGQAKRKVPRPRPVFDALFQDGTTIRPRPECVCDGQVRRTGEQSHTSADHDVSWLSSVWFLSQTAASAGLAWGLSDGVHLGLSQWRRLQTGLRVCQRPLQPTLDADGDWRPALGTGPKTRSKVKPPKRSVEAAWLESVCHGSECFGALPNAISIHIHPYPSWRRLGREKSH